MAKIAFLVADLYEDSEFRVPYDAVRKAGHTSVVGGLEAGTTVQGKRGNDQVEIEVRADDLDPQDFDALVLPGGYSPDKLRLDDGAVSFTRRMFDAGKPVAAICHAGWMLAESGIAEGRTLTSWPSVRTDLVNAGAHWVDREVVEDGNLITARKPADLDAFCRAILRQLEQRRAA